MMNLIRKIGTWIHEWPCSHGFHVWGLYTPGRSMWHRDCEFCDKSDMTIYPKYGEADIKYYNEVYLQSRGVG